MKAVLLSISSGLPVGVAVVGAGVGILVGAAVVGVTVVQDRSE
jgi:F0F1-type ATP synthase membrane subunit c/vacuolar-type H+-ATPase subunit K